MFKSLAIASLVAGAAAFAPAQQGASSTALKAFESELGSQPPLGFFDPLGLLTNADQERFERLRYVELKHGRICQLVSRVSCGAAMLIGYMWVYVGCYAKLCGLLMESKYRMESNRIIATFDFVSTVQECRRMRCAATRELCDVLATYV